MYSLYLFLQLFTDLNCKAKMTSGFKLDHQQCDQIGRFLNFGQLFKALGNNLFAQIFHILRQFL